MEKSLIVSSSPHLHSGASTRTIMLDVLIALLPAAVASVWLFGWRALAIELVCVGACVASETLSRSVMKRPQTVGDLSCVVTGLLLAFNDWTMPAQLQAADAVSSATPLAMMAGGGEMAYKPFQLLFGIHPGCLGETCAAALIIGGIYLVIRRVITPIIPLCYIGTVFVLTWILGENPVYHILSGGLMLGAIFMATDYTTSPINKAGKVVFAVLCGLLTVLIRLYGSLTEGVSFAILIGNILVPLIERATRPRAFGTKRRLLRHEK